MAIPKIIHQVWEGRTEPKMPTRLRILARTWQEQNPDWEYHLWNGEEMDELVEKHFPDILSMYRSFPYNVQRWDTIRYMILYVYGGLYTDLDTECFRPIDPLLKDVRMAFGEESPLRKDKPTRIGNAFMVSEKGKHGWLILLDEICRDIQKKDTAVETVMCTTGPNRIDRLFTRLKNEDGASYLPYRQVTPVSKYDMYEYIYRGDRDLFQEKTRESYCAHYFFGSWDSSLSFYKGGEA